MQTITNIDLRLLNWIHEHLACSFLDFLMPKITFLGNGGLIWIAAAIIMIFFKKYRKIGIMIGTGLSAGVIIGNILLKNLIARERPCWINETVQMLISTPQDYSFPSGHTLSSFVAATLEDIIYQSENSEKTSYNNNDNNYPATRVIAATEDWHKKFANHFSNTVIITDNEYKSPNL